jgi:pimeloyl-ACP methyl ester carboxylesterase
MSQPPQLEGVAHRYVDAAGITFHIADAGAGDPPVLLLHGWPQHWYMWRKVIPRLAERHRVLALDLRGFGWSDAPEQGYLKEQMAGDVLRVLDALDLERVDLAGHDWGGWIGFLLALRAPDRIRRFLALNIVHPWPTLGRGWRRLPRFTYQGVIMAPWLGYALHRRRSFVRRMLLGGARDRAAFEPEALDSFADNLAEPARARAAVRLYRDWNLHELIPVVRGRYRASRLAVPTRIVFGTADPVLSPDLLAGYEPYADDLEVELVRRCGHFIADQRPDLVAERALALFA